MRSFAFVLSLVLVSACSLTDTNDPHPPGGSGYGPPAICSDPRATNYGHEGDCMYPPPKPAYTVFARHVSTCSVVGLEKLPAFAGFTYTYVDTTFAVLLPTDTLPRTVVMYLRDSLGTLISGVPLKWHSNAPAIYDINPSRWISPGIAWVVGLLDYAGKSYADSVPVQVVEGPYLDDKCK